MVFYRLISILFIVSTIFLDVERGKPPLSTEGYGQFIDFLSIIHRFQIEAILLQEFDADDKFCLAWSKDKNVLAFLVQNNDNCVHFICNIEYAFVFCLLLIMDTYLTTDIYALCVW